MVPPLWVQLAIALAIAAGGFTGGWKVRAWKAAADEHALAMQLERDALRRQEAASDAGVRYESWKAAQRPRAVVATREVQHAVQIDPWGAQPVPDGVRLSLEAAARGTGAAVADGAVPGVPAAAAVDESGPGPGLRVGAGLGGGLRGPAEGAW